MRLLLFGFTLTAWGSLLTPWDIKEFGLPYADFVVDDDKLQIPRTDSTQDTVEECFVIFFSFMTIITCHVLVSKQAQSYFLVSNALLKKNHGSKIQVVRSLPPGNITSFSKTESLVIITKLFGSEIRVYKIDISKSYQASDRKHENRKF